MLQVRFQVVGLLNKSVVTTVHNLRTSQHYLSEAIPYTTRRISLVFEHVQHFRGVGLWLAPVLLCRALLMSLMYLAPKP